MIAGIEGPLRIWYAADEWVLHHVSQVRLFEPRSWSNLAEAAIKGAYERAFRRRLDRVWAVSNADRLALRGVAGIPRVDVLPNGVDAAHYQSAGAGEEPLTAVFWGRLDFGPNVQALEWFCSRVWPHVKAARRDAQFTIMGFCLTPQVAVLANTPGVRVTPDVTDIRPEVARHAIVVLPFISGRGIKNKLLEAAAMGKAVVCTPGALSGVQGTAPFRPIKRPHDWVSSIIRLWDHPDERRRLGEQARQWVVREHTWAAVAQKALAGVEDSLQSR